MSHFPRGCRELLTCKVPSQWESLTSQQVLGLKQAGVIALQTRKRPEKSKAIQSSSISLP